MARDAVSTPVANTDAGSAPPGAPPRPFSDIPGPRGLDLFRTLAGFGKRPLETLTALRSTYGDIVALRFPLDRIVFVCDPEGIEHVLVHAHHRYAKATARWKTMRQVWGEGLLTADGDMWRRQRQRMQPAFHQRYLRDFGLTMVAEAEKVAEAWTTVARSGEPHDVYPDMLRCTLRALLKAMFGSDVDEKSDLLIKAVGDINGYIDPTAPSNLLNLPIPVRRWV